MIDNFGQILVEVRDAASRCRVRPQILAASSEIAKGAGMVAIRSCRHQFRRGDGGSMRQVLTHAEFSADNARQSRPTSGRATEPWRHLDGMNRVDAAAFATAEKMRALGQRSEKVFEIVA